MTFNPVNELLKAVDALSAEQVSTVWQEVDGDPKPTKVMMTPLIRDLRGAVSSNIGAQGAGGSLQSQRSVIDSEALEMYQRIEDDILKSFSEVTSAVPFLMPEQNLRQWFIAFTNNYKDGRISESALFKAMDRWSGWVSRIENKLWPATSLEVTSPCPMPECGQRWASNDGEAIPAIIIEYRSPVDGQNPLSRSIARCRACGEVWRGDFRLRQLRHALDLSDQILEKNPGQEV
jgi:hypothetical protein